MVYNQYRDIEFLKNRRFRQGPGKCLSRSHKFVKIHQKIGVAGLYTVVASLKPTGTVYNE
jgi:hypothetical protein